MENTEITKIPFEVNRIPDSTKPVGEEIVVQDGVYGTRTIITFDGSITSDRTIAPKNAVVYYGTKEDEVPSQELENSSDSTNVQDTTLEPVLEDEVTVNSELKDDFQPGVYNVNNKRSTMNGKALFVRALKTFVQAGLATWAVTGFDFTTGAIVGATSAGISALMNLFIQPTEAK